MRAVASERAPAIVVPIDRLDRAALRALALALALSSDVTALHVDAGTIETARIRERWRRHREGIGLAIVGPSSDPLGEYIASLPHGDAVVVLPLIGTRRPWLDPITSWRTLRLPRRLARRLGVVVVPSVLTT